MIITKTPFRMSFFGGGTDMVDYFKEYGGAVLSTTFDKYCYVTVRHLPRFFDYKTHLTYSKMEYVNSYDEIQHPLVTMEQSVGSGTASKHQCEECSKEGTHSLTGLSGATEYYCTEHYNEIMEMLEALSGE